MADGEEKEPLFIGAISGRGAEQEPLSTGATSGGVGRAGASFKGQQVAEREEQEPLFTGDNKWQKWKIRSPASQGQ